MTFDFDYPSKTVCIISGLYLRSLSLLKEVQAIKIAVMVVQRESNKKEKNILCKHLIIWLSTSFITNITRT